MHVSSLVFPSLSREDSSRLHARLTAEWWTHDGLWVVDPRRPTRSSVYKGTPLWGGELTTAVLQTEKSVGRTKVVGEPYPESRSCHGHRQSSIVVGIRFFGGLTSSPSHSMGLIHTYLRMGLPIRGGVKAHLVGVPGMEFPRPM